MHELIHMQTQKTDMNRRNKGGEWFKAGKTSFVGNSSDVAERDDGCQERTSRRSQDWGRSVEPFTKVRTWQAHCLLAHSSRAQSLVLRLGVKTGHVGEVQGGREKRLPQRRRRCGSHLTWRWHLGARSKGSLFADHVEWTSFWSAGKVSQKPEEGKRTPTVWLGEGRRSLGQED